MTTQLKILLMLSAVILTGCQACPTTPIKPERPRLESLVKNPEGGITLNRQDALDLILYVYDLEDGYE